MTKGKLWDRPEQTFGKHLVLEHYLSAWLPILGRWHDRLLIIDGFAGPGEYRDGSRGSPVIALDCVREHRQRGNLDGVEVTCAFIESNLDTARHLKSVLQGRASAENERYEVVTGAFEHSVAGILDSLQGAGRRLPPAFVMVDPFGVKGVRMEFIERILTNPRSECMVSFMYEAINRHQTTEEFQEHLDHLFGSPAWRTSQNMESAERRAFLHELFRQQLKRHGGKQVVPFELWRGGRHVYTLFFASGSLKGCDVMKKSMWKVDRSGGYAFRGWKSTAKTLFELAGVDNVKGPLGDELKQAFGGKWVPVEALEKFVMSDGTMFHTGHLRRHTLGPLEREGRLDVSRPSDVHGFSNGKGIKIKFR